MSVIEIIEFNTRPGTTPEILKQALDTLDHELTAIGGFLSRDLYRTAGAEDGWLLDYKWITLDAAQKSMSKVATTDAFTKLMSLVEFPDTMNMKYGTLA